MVLGQGWYRGVCPIDRGKPLTLSSSHGIAVRLGCRRHGISISHGMSISHLVPVRRGSCFAFSQCA